MEYRSFSFTSEGGREENQDAAAAREKASAAIYIVADGLGGHQDGKLASECVTQTLVQAWEAAPPENQETWLKEQFAKVQEQLLEFQEKKNSTMKSTAAVLTLRDSTAVWANTGDSRVYHLRGSRIEHVTEDHSVAYKKYKAGEISRAQINTDDDQSCLLKALGNKDKWQPDIGGCEVEAGDGFLLCSDGVWEYVYDEEIIIDWLKAETPDEWAELLLMRMLDRIKPGNDNLTIMTVAVR